jgi:hypothetical protein
VLTLIAEFHVVGAGDVGQRRAPARRVREIAEPASRPVHQQRDGAALLHDRNEIGVRVLTAILRPEVPVAGVRQQAARNRRRPCHLMKALKRGVPCAGRCLRCDCRRTTGGAAGVALEAHTLLVPEDVELVSRCRLQRQAQRHLDPGAVVDGTPAQVRFVRPRIGIAGVLVVIHPRHVKPRPLIFC